jgi:micrococcal nuclease
VRLYGVDAPETRKPDKPGQPFGSQAKRVLMFKVLGKEVTVEVQDRMISMDVRLPCCSWQAGILMPRWWRKGWPGPIASFLSGPYASRYIALEEQARRQHRGLWRDTNPQPPWEFRRGQNGGVNFHLFGQLQGPLDP